VLVAWEPATAIAWHSHGGFGRTAEAVLIVTGFVATVGTLAWGGVLAGVGRWRQLGMSVAAGSAALLTGYAVVMVVAASATNTTVDNGAGAGAVILALPTVIVVSAVLFLGALASRLVARRKSSV
jgi:ribosomal protein S12 methylthiotransferase accessory factor YcaO